MPCKALTDQGQTCEKYVQTLWTKKKEVDNMWPEVGECIYGKIFF